MYQGFYHNLKLYGCIQVERCSGMLSIAHVQSIAPVILYGVLNYANPTELAALSYQVLLTIVYSKLNLLCLGFYR